MTARQEECPNQASMWSLIKSMVTATRYEDDCHSCYRSITGLIVLVLTSMVRTMSRSSMVYVLYHTSCCSMFLLYLLSVSNTAPMYVFEKRQSRVTGNPPTRVNNTPRYSAQNVHTGHRFNAARDKALKRLASVRKLLLQTRKVTSEQRIRA